MKSLIIVAVVLLSLQQASSQTVLVSCNFFGIVGYTCGIAGTSIADNENANFVITGFHNIGRSNADVTRVQITLSSIPFIIPAFFETFPNLNELVITNGGLNRIQGGAFANARNLRTVTINSNGNLRTIHATAFTGAVNLLDVDLSNNQIDDVHESIFAGISSVRSINFDNNGLRVLPANIFRTLNSLLTVTAVNNFIQGLDGNLFANHPQIRDISFWQNQISAIGRNFLDRMTELSSLNMLENNCATSLWIIGGVTTIETVRQGLATCFNNSVETPPEAPIEDVKHFTFELRGTLIIRDANGTEVGRL